MAGAALKTSGKNSSKVRGLSGLREAGVCVERGCLDNRPGGGGSAGSFVKLSSVKNALGPTTPGKVSQFPGPERHGPKSARLASGHEEKVRMEESGLGHPLIYNPISRSVSTRTVGLPFGEPLQAGACCLITSAAGLVAPGENPRLPAGDDKTAGRRKPMLLRGRRRIESWTAGPQFDAGVRPVMQKPPASCTISGSPHASRISPPARVVGSMRRGRAHFWLKKSMPLDTESVHQKKRDVISGPP